MALFLIVVTLGIVLEPVLSRDKAASGLSPGSESTPWSQAPNPSVKPSRELRLRPGKARKPLVKASPCVPDRLIIPAIGVNTVVLPIMGSAGAPVPPDNPTEASWMSNGVVPGNPGAAPIQGHTWSMGDGVFDHLGDPAMKPGDVIVVQGNGCRLTFVVRHVWRHVPPATAGSAIYPVRGKASLTVVTCGDYNGGTYHSRIVVRAFLRR